MKFKFTDRTLSNLKKLPNGKPRDQYSDTELKGFGVLVYEDKKVFFAQAKPPGPVNQIKVTLKNPFDGHNVEESRELARQHLKAIRAGENPNHIQAADAENTFYAVACQYFAAMPKGKKTKRIKENAIFQSWMGMKRRPPPSPTLSKTDLLIYQSMPAWVSNGKPILRDRNIASITTRDIRERYREIAKERTAFAARNMTTMLRPLFSWAIKQGHYGITSNPCQGMGDEDFGLERRQLQRKRELYPHEIPIAWHHSTSLGVYGDIFKVLLLTILRRKEVGMMRWSEIDGDTFHLPPERDKNGEGRLIALPPMALSIINSQPRYPNCPFVFTENGKTPFHQYDKRIEKLRKLCGFEEHWKLHDLRRTGRSNLSRLRWPDNVCEAILGHRQKGILQVYNQYDFLDQQREALVEWENRVKEFLSPPPSGNVVRLPGRGRALGA